MAYPFLPRPFCLPPFLDPLFEKYPSTSGNSITGSERPSPEPLLKKEASPCSRTGGGENSGNALEPSNALNYRAWEIPAVLSREIPGKALRAFPGSFRKVPAVPGVWPAFADPLITTHAHLRQNSLAIAMASVYTNAMAWCTQVGSALQEWKLVGQRGEGLADVAMKEAKTRYRLVSDLFE